METTTTIVSTETEFTVETGDVFESSWGYDQTNVDYYEVVGFTPSGKSVRLRPIGKRGVPGSDGFMSRRVVANPGEFRGGEFTKRLKRADWKGRDGRSPWYIVCDYDCADHIKRADVATTSTYESWYA